MRFEIVLLFAALASCHLRATSAARCPRVRPPKNELSAEHPPGHLGKMFAAWNSIPGNETELRRQWAEEDRTTPAPPVNCTTEEEEILAKIKPIKLITQMTGEEDITEFLFKDREPSWMDSCRRRPELPTVRFFQDIELILYMESPEELAKARLEPEPWLDEFRERHRRNNKTNNKLTTTTKIPRQSKRSPSEQQHHENFFVVSTIAPTSTTEAPKPQWVLDMDEQELQNYARIKQLVFRLYKLDVQISWLTLAAHAAAKNLQKLSAGLIEWIHNLTIQYHDAVGPPVSPERRSEILAAKRKWLPTFHELSADQKTASFNSPYNFSAGLDHEQTRRIMFNLTHYLQFFAVATEQMRFDQDNFIPPLKPLVSQAYKHLDDFVLKLLCDCDNLLNLLREFEATRREFENLLVTYEPKKMEKYGDYYDQLVGHKLPRDLEYQSGPQEFESAIEFKYKSLAPEQQRNYTKTIISFMDWAREEDQRRAKDDKEREQLKEFNQKLPDMNPVGYPPFIWREIMPLEQRQLYTLRERVVRDLSILEDFTPLAETFKSLFFYNHLSYY